MANAKLTDQQAQEAADVYKECGKVARDAAIKLNLNYSTFCSR